MSIHQYEEDRVMIKQILTRLDRCENDSLAKEKQMASMKVTIEELRAELNAANTTMKSLETTNKELSRRVEYLESNVADMVAVKVETEAIKSKVDVIKSKQNTTDNDIMCLERISTLEQDMEQLKSSLKEVTSAKLATIKNDMEMFRANTQEQLSNLESVMFMHDPVPNKNIVLQWVMKDHRQRRDIGDYVYSPMFSSIDGYRLKIRVQWLGKNKDKIGLHLELFRPEKLHKLPPFKREYTFRLQKNRGAFEEYRVTYDDKYKWISIPDGQLSTLLWGFKTDSPAHHFVINNSLFVTCKIHLD